MEYCKKIILEKIQEQMDSMKGNKLILRIENFEDARFYLEIYQYCKEICKTRNMQFEAKLTLGAWKKLINTEGENYNTRQLETLDVVDKKNRITYYRNEIVDSPKLVLFLGTEYAEDKAGLNELFLLNPSMLENKIKNHYSIIFEKYREIIRDADRKRLDHFYEELFRHVPKNLMHLSCIVDELPGNIETFEDMMQVIFSRLYRDWGMPDIDSFQISKIKEKGKLQVLEKANQFVKRSKFKTQNDIKKAYQKIEAYKEDKKEELSWKNIRGFSSFGEFEQSLREYIAGKNIPANREKLCHTDFVLINDILDLKIQKPPKTKESQEKLYDEPFLMLQKALFQTLGLLEQSQLEQLENFQMEVESIKLAGIYGEDEDDDTRRSEEEYWKLRLQVLWRTALLYQ